MDILTLIVICFFLIGPFSLVLIYWTLQTHQHRQIDKKEDFPHA